MGSPLGPTFANYYMGYLEEKVFSAEKCKPTVYARFVDDVFVQVRSIKELNELKELFQSNSVLKFTYEESINSKIPFLDVLVHSTPNGFITTVYHKPTDSGKCLNANSECTDMYKDSVAKNYLNHAYKVSSNWEDFHNEVVHIKQVLINNNTLL